MPGLYLDLIGYTCLLHAASLRCPGLIPANQRMNMATLPLAQWMDAWFRVITNVAVPSRGNVPAVDGIAG
jgi:hypothetical protein